MVRGYSDTIFFVKDEIVKYLKDIFKVYGNELILKLEEYNLLKSENNCIESSTAIGFIMEEFITSKLEIYTKNHFRKKQIMIHRVAKSTGNSSYDCYAEYKGIFVMINVKVQKNTSVNNAISAINILYNDYVNDNPDIIKAYLVLKTYYSFGASSINGERKILIRDVDGYFLEQIDFSKGYKQDHRNWSANFNSNSGRLQITSEILNNNQLNKKDISYEKTRQFITEIFLGNMKK